MVIAACQPYFAPFSGFFARALSADILVLMDSVQFPLGSSWLTRNRFKSDQGILWLNIPVWRKGLGLQKICNVRICHERHWASKRLESLKTAYLRAPYFEEHVQFLEETFSERWVRLLDLNIVLIKYLLRQLHARIELLLLSQLQIDKKEPQLSVEICKKVGATHFLAQKTARGHLDERRFDRAGVRLVFRDFTPPVYPQLWGHFISNLSAFDLLFNCGPKSLKIIKAASGR
jgi:hypothetical protein